MLHGRLVSYARNLEQILAISRSGNVKESVLITDGTSHIRAVALKQLNSYLLNGLLGIAVGNLTGYQSLLSKGCYCHQQQQHRQNRFFHSIFNLLLFPTMSVFTHNRYDILLSFLLLDCFDALNTPRFNAF